MTVGTAEIRLYAPWVHSLKEKRMLVKSLLAKLHNKYNVSSAEVADQDIHQSAVIGVACAAGDASMADSVIDHILNYIDQETEAEIVNVNRQIY